MFTGLVQTLGEVTAIEPREEGRTLVIRGDIADPDKVLGASIAVSGVCLTVTAFDARGFTVDAAFETLDKTTLGELSVADRVNLEPSLRLGDPIGGHLVSGHVDGIGRLERVESRGAARECWFSVPKALAGLVAVKGSICIEGVSLTVNAVDGERFMVGLIPHTLAVTTLGALEAGDAVNVEVDQLARYVARRLEFERDPSPGHDTGAQR